MRSGNPDIYKPPGGRTEQEVAAELCVRLLEAEMVPRTPRSVVELANLVGVPVRKIREVWAPEARRNLRIDESPISQREPLRHRQLVVLS